MTDHLSDEAIFIQDMVSLVSAIKQYCLFHTTPFYSYYLSGRSVCKKNNPQVGMM